MFFFCQFKNQEIKLNCFFHTVKVKQNNYESLVLYGVFYECFKCLSAFFFITNILKIKELNKINDNYYLN